MYFAELDDLLSCGIGLGALALTLLTLMVYAVVSATKEKHKCAETKL